MNATQYPTSDEPGSSCIGCKYSTCRRIDTRNGICTESGEITIIRWESGKCGKYDEGTTP